MQISGLKLTNFLSHRYLDLPIAPMTVISGPNACGKTAIADAVAFVVMGDLRRINAKSEREMLLTEGTEAGRVTLECGSSVLERDIATGKLKRNAARLPLSPGAVTEAVPYLLDCRRIAAVEPDARAALLRAVTSDGGAAAVLALLVERGHPASLVQQLMPGGSIADWTTHALRAASEARGAWRAVTGEQYGPVKAEGFTMALPSTPAAPLNLDTLKAEEAAALADVERLQREIGDLAATTRAHANMETQAAKLRRIADWLPTSIANVHGADAELSALRAAAAAARSAHANVEASAKGSTMSCPGCQAPLDLVEGVLVHGTRAEHPATPAQLRESTARLARIERQLQDATNRRTELAAELAEATAATDALRLLTPTAPSSQHPDLDSAELDRKLAAARGRVRTATQARTNAERDGLAAKRAADATAAATGHHAAVKAWTLITEALAPDGIPGELLGRTLAPFNDTLRGYASATGWRQVTIGADMAIRADGRPYALLSRSEQWRADAMLTCALAACSDVGFVVLDEMDVLQVSARSRAMTWLYSLTQTEHLDTVLLLATLSSKPSAPPDVAVHWLGTDAAVIAEPERQAA